MAMPRHWAAYPLAVGFQQVEIISAILPDAPGQRLARKTHTSTPKASANKAVWLAASTASLNMWGSQNCSTREVLPHSVSSVGSGP